MDQVQFTTIIKNQGVNFSKRIGQLLEEYHTGESARQGMLKQAERTGIPVSTFWRKVNKEIPFNVHQIMLLAKHMHLPAAQTRELVAEHIASFEFDKSEDYVSGLKKLMQYFGTSPKKIEDSLGYREMDNWLNMPGSRIPYIDFMAILEIGLGVRMMPKVWKEMKPVVTAICKQHKATAKWGKKEGSYNFNKLQEEFDLVAKETLEKPMVSSVKEARLGASVARKLGVSSASVSDGMARGGEEYLDALSFLRIRELLGYRLEETTGRPGIPKRKMDRYRSRQLTGLKEHEIEVSAKLNPDFIADTMLPNNSKETDLQTSMQHAMLRFRRLYKIDEQATAPALISAMGRMIGCTDEELGRIMGHSKVSSSVMLAQYKAKGFIIDELRLTWAVAFFGNAHEALKEKYGISCFNDNDMTRLDALNDQARSLHLGVHPKAGTGSGPKPNYNYEKTKRCGEEVLARI